MTLIKEIEKIIPELPIEKASSLKYWLNEFQAARRYKYLKAYTMAAETLADFEDGNGNALWN